MPFDLKAFRTKIESLDPSELESEEANLTKVFSNLNQEYRDRLETLHLVMAQLEIVRDKINSSKDVYI